ncbi:sigma-54-dependent Fis family transcriptional regulator [Microbacterium sp. MYb62]|uniref:sigma-54-dependent Fis family transcriptional regulator n=1 Tax=Microbacterium sp. MYb62 TaxID=1848690 RepID=UPI000CFA9140|nr:helix-turn-helix domain-containing protein [Microbacterium sp. MYb62]PRB16573.1 Fis family transcriptional regulator [Microbacterium sp. MYb62]
MTTAHARPADQAKEALLSGTDLARPARPDLMISWQRSKDALGSPGNIRDVPQVGLDLLDSHLLEMFQAPLARVSDELDGTGLGLLLADSEGRILQRWTHDRSAAAHLDRLGTVRGAVLSEAAVGTNGVGTVAATGRSVQITGEEHFAEFYRSAVCTGSPVRHPITGRLLAVVTISTRVTERAELLRPLTHSIAAQLGQHVVEAERPAARSMLAAFLSASRTQSGPVVAVGPDGLLMQNQRAARLTSADLGLLQRLCTDDARSGRIGVEFSGGHADIQVTRLDAGAGAVAVIVEPERRVRHTGFGPARPVLAGRSPEWLGIAQLVGRHREARTPLLIAGEAGTGKTSLALGHPHRPGSSAHAASVDAAERHVLGAKRWLQRLSERLERGAAVIVRGIETLDAPSTSGMKSLIDSTGARSAVLLTMSAATQADAEAAATRLGYPVAWVPALRERSGDIALLWRALADHAAPAAHLEPTREALVALEAHSWSGNLIELRNAIEHLAMSGRRGAIGVADLPMSIRGTRTLSMIERVELEAIQRALQEAGGNRSRAAEILGLSRATVYRKMKTYRLSA